MKISSLFSGLFTAVSLWTLPTHAATIWQIGLDNNATASTEMDAEYQADDMFYLHAGNYTHLQGYTSLVNKSYGEDRTILGAEVAADGATSQDGFERALTSGDPTTNVFFQLSASDVVSPEFKFTLDLLNPSLYAASPPAGERPPAYTDIAVYFNNQLIGTSVGITAAKLLEFTFTPASVNAVAGSNVISIHRTGGAIPSGWSSSYISIDYLALSTVPEPSRLLLGFGGLLALTWLRRRH